ncbi:hypothetical protein H9P43_009554 [Blastocladiella emersonii ATCC 22665]|nr:hypothetical protein H9P43_009554 [Blastocladiella emersonii ATCC 22665]
MEPTLPTYRPAAGRFTNDDGASLLPRSNPRRNSSISSSGSSDDDDKSSKKHARPDDQQPAPAMRAPRFTAGVLLASVALFAYFMLFHDADMLTKLGLDNSGDHHLEPKHLTLVHNVTVHTMDDWGFVGAGLVLRKGRVVRVVHAANVAHSRQALASAGARLVDGRGAVVLPGLVDSHGHLVEQGLAQSRPELVRAKSLEAVRAHLHTHAIAAKMAGVPFSDTRWLRGQGWDHTKWTDAVDGPGAFPTAADLDVDPVLREIPIVLARVDVHGYLLNRRAIELLGPLPDTVVGGAIKRTASGEPAGVFLDNAMALVDGAIPPLKPADIRNAVRKAQTALLEAGLVGMHNAGTLPAELAVLAQMDRERDLRVRVYAMARCPQPAPKEHLQVGAPTFCADRFVRAAREANLTVPTVLADDNHGRLPRLVMRSIKMFLDGALGSHGAALIEPYTDSPSDSGIVICSTRACPELAPVVRQWHAAGWQVNIHAIGDHANRLAIAALEKLPAAARPRIEHAQIVHPDDIPRLARAGIIPSMQPTHATSDMAYAAKRLGDSRLRGAYAWQSLLRARVPALALGSDFPVEPVDPLKGIYAAVARMDYTGASPAGEGKPWIAHEALTPHQAVKGLTRDAAFASFMDAHAGAIVPDAVADFTVLDADILAEGVAADPARILRARVVATVVDGKAEYVNREHAMGGGWATLA